MKNEEEQLKIPLECYVSGKLEILSMKETIDELLRANHGIVAPLNACKWDINGQRGYNKDIFNVAGEKPITLGLFIYIFHGQPFSIDEAESIINGKKELDQGNFIAWAARFNKIFRKGHFGQSLSKRNWPFYYLKIVNGSCLRPAYQMRDDFSSFVIMGIDKNIVEPTIIPDWSLLWRIYLENQK